MTDRMSNVEIEDVLSSIRKLVSDDLRPGAAPVAPVSPPPRPAVPRLVLTPALRVPAAPAAPPEMPEALAPDALAAPDDGIAGRLAELEALMAGQAHEFEDEATAHITPLRATPDLHSGDLVEEAPYVTDDDTLGADGFDWADPAPAPADPVAELDDAVLRDLIRDVLREELQGVMGERVTRNLRKLVRAEIARALTARGIA